MLLGRSKLVCTWLLTQILTWRSALFTPKNFGRPTTQEGWLWVNGKSDTWENFPKMHGKTEFYDCSALENIKEDSLVSSIIWINASSWFSKLGSDTHSNNAVEIWFLGTTGPPAASSWEEGVQSPCIEEDVWWCLAVERERRKLFFAFWRSNNGV